MESLWSETVKRPSFEALLGDLKTDVLIIGGGITGILCAYMLKNSGVDCVLCEQDELCSGITKNTTAKITLQHGLIYGKMLRRFGLEKTQSYIAAQTEALSKYREIAKSIECDFESKPSFVYSRTAYGRAKLERETAALERLGCKARFLETTELPLSVTGAVRVDGQAQFHPLKLAFGLAGELSVYEHTKILSLAPGAAITPYGKISARHIIVATHFPFLNKHGFYFLKLYQHRSYVIALKSAARLSGMYVDENEKGLSFRNAGELLLLGGGSHRTGKKGGAWGELSDFAKEHYGKAVEVYRWATQDCMTLDSIPYIGKYSNRTQNLYVATGFNKWGMSSAMVAAILLSDMVEGKKNEWASVFSPSRSILHPQLAVNILETAKSILTPTVPRCSHLGCALKYNKEEHSWDCPCHGSRFSEDGKLLDNPATESKIL